MIIKEVKGISVPDHITLIEFNTLKELIDNTTPDYEAEQHVILKIVGQETYYAFDDNFCYFYIKEKEKKKKKNVK